MGERDDEKRLLLDVLHMTYKDMQMISPKCFLITNGFFNEDNNNLTRVKWVLTT
jgi:hypothetical protein